MSLSAFLNPIREENLKIIISKRFINEDGSPIKWEIKAITAEEDEALRKACVRKIPIYGKYGQSVIETDYDKYLGKLAAACTVFPNLNDSALQDTYKAMGSDALLKNMLKPGEYAMYLKKIQEINGFDEPMEKLVEEAKN